MKVAEFFIEGPNGKGSTFSPDDLLANLERGCVLTGIVARSTPPCFSPKPGACVVVVEEQ